MAVLALLTACSSADGIVDVQLAPVVTATGEETPANRQKKAQAFLGGFLNDRRGGRAFCYARNGYAGY